MEKNDQVYVGDHKKCKECKYGTYISGGDITRHKPILAACNYINNTGQSRVFRLGTYKKVINRAFATFSSRNKQALY